ncbi:hypothetical protein V2J09_013716 [Rumex salicifolius]
MGRHSGRPTSSFGPARCRAESKPTRTADGHAKCAAKEADESGFRNSSSVQSVVAVERTVFYREKRAGMYSPLAYSLTQLIIEIPYCFPQTIVYVIIRIPVWWTWYIWACPFAWSLYGLVVSQFGDVEDKLENGEMVKEFLRSYFGFRHDFLWIVAAIVLGFSLLFSFIFV